MTVEEVTTELLRIAHNRAMGWQTVTDIDTMVLEDGLRVKVTCRDRTLEQHLSAMLDDARDKVDKLKTQLEDSESDLSKARRELRALKGQS